MTRQKQCRRSRQRRWRIWTCFALKFLEQFRDALGFRDEGHAGRTIAVDRVLVERDVVDLEEILDADDADDVIEVLVEDREARVFLLAEEGAQIGDGMAGLDGDDVGARRHHFAREGIAEVNDRLQQPFLVASR